MNTPTNTYNVILKYCNTKWEEVAKLIKYRKVITSIFKDNCIYLYSGNPATPAYPNIYYDLEAMTWTEIKSDVFNESNVGYCFYDTDHNIHYNKKEEYYENQRCKYTYCLYSISIETNSKKLLYTRHIPVCYIFLDI